MIVAESRRVRRLIGRLDRGSELIEALLEVCRAHSVRSGELRATGALEQAVVNEFDQRARAYRPPRRFDAQLELLHLYGNVSERDGKLAASARVSLSRERDNGIELVGGLLVSARVFAVEFVIEAFDDVVLRRAPDPSTGLSLWREAIALGGAVPVEESAPSAAPRVAFEAPALTVAMPHSGEAPSWQEVAAVSAEADAAPAPPAAGADDDARPSPGDFIEHPKFGRCQVERIEGDYDFVSARLRNQRLIRLSLDVLTLVFVGKEDGKLVFRAEPAAR